MTVTSNPSVISVHVANTFMGATYTDTLHSIGYYAVCGGVQPANPLVEENVVYLSSTTALLPSGASWLPPSDGVISLSIPLDVSPIITGAITFVRLYSTDGSTAIFDIPAGLLGSGKGAILSTLNAVMGFNLSITDLKIKINTSGEASLSSAIANFMLEQFIGLDPVTLKCASRIGSTNVATDEINLDVYTGTIPARADSIATGTMIWSKSITEDNLFKVQGPGVSLFTPLTANPAAAGVPSYLRVTKVFADASASLVFQVPIGGVNNGCRMSESTLALGVPATLTNLTMVFST